MGAIRGLIALFTVLILTGSVAYADGPELTVEYDGWVPERAPLIKFTIRNNGDAASEKTTGKGETISPRPPQETAPLIPPIDPGGTHEVLYSVWPADDCQNHVVRMSVPLANDADPTDNTLDAQLCDTDTGADLKLEYIGFDAADFHRIKYRVTNVGQESTEPTTAKFETVSTPGSLAFTPDVPGLDPGDVYEILFTFGGQGCQSNLVEVRASVLLDDDRYPINNDNYQQVCKMLPITPTLPDPVGPSPRVSHDPVTLTFDGIVLGNPRAQAPDPACSEIAVADRPRTVGYQNADETPGGCNWRQYWRLLFKFDVSTLRGVNLKPVKAELDFNENVYLERAPDGGRPDVGPRFVATCGLRLGRPVADWYRFGARFGFEPVGSPQPEPASAASRPR